VLRDGERRFVEIHDVAGWTARVRVLDAEGAPVPCASLRARHVVQRVRCYPTANGAQDLYPLTDGEGEARFDRLSEGPVEVTAVYGSRRASVTIDVTDPYRVIRLPEAE
jgi:hypothetical protein